jgi:multidrug efflux pump subunit AcrB
LYIDFLYEWRFSNMTLRPFAMTTVGAVAGAALLALTIAPATAMTLSAPSLAPGFSASQIDKVHWWGHRHCWRGWRGYWRCRYW